MSNELLFERDIEFYIKTLSKSSQRNYKQAWQKFEKELKEFNILSQFKNKQWQEIEPQVINIISSILLKKHISKARYIVALLRFIGFGSKRFWKSVLSRISKTVPTPIVKRHFLSPDQFWKLYEYTGKVNPSLQLGVELQYFFGLRASEALGIRYNILKRLPEEQRDILDLKEVKSKDDFYFDKEDKSYHLLIHGKGGKDTNFKLPEEIANDITSQVEDNVLKLKQLIENGSLNVKEQKRLLYGYLIPMRYSLYYREIRKVSEEVFGYPIGTHDLRRSFALRIYEMTNHDIYVTKELMRHSVITTTTKYFPKFSSEDRFHILLKSIKEVNENEVDRKGEERRTKEEVDSKTNRTTETRTSESSRTYSI